MQPPRSQQNQQKSTVSQQGNTRRLEESPGAQLIELQ